jgi:transcriptional regulator with XRE-family HTH domain
MARSYRSRAFGIALREYRDTSGMTQEQLGLAAERDRKFIWLLEGGHQQPTLDTLSQLAQALEIAPAVLVARTSSLEARSAGIVKRTHKRPSLVALHQDTCPKCRAIYTVYARKLPARASGRFKCDFCKRSLCAWTGTTALIHKCHRPPRFWPLKRQ